MLVIPCPHCGPRDEGEFDHGGPVRTLPALDGAASAADWQRALHLPAADPGPMRQLWFHRSGCETWVEVTRDPSTHCISAARPAGAAGGGS
ncbi:MAG: sarcosine oxidase subunit delta [Rhodobacteraceae bacterium]|nr:sarcosine oxidase subunit delta [Paracoccaceae bacterium]